MDCFLEITIDGQEDIRQQTSESLLSNNAHWKNYEASFRYACKYEELQKKFFEINLR
jgi:hypothetical protein